MGKLETREGFDRTQHYLDVRQIQGDVTLKDLQVQCTHMDGGSMTCTTDRKELLWNYQRLDKPPVALRVADKRKHFPIGQGDVYIPMRGGGMLKTRCYHTPPTMPATILSPAEIAELGGFDGSSIDLWLNGEGCGIKFKTRCGAKKCYLDLELQRGLLFTLPH